MAFTIPTFNLPVNIWRNASGGPPAPPDVVTIGNLAYGHRVHPVQPNTNSGPVIADMFLLLPAGTDIRDVNSGGLSDIVEVGAGTGRIYSVIAVDDAGGGFANEHRVAILWKQNALWPLPYPRPAGGPPVLVPSTIASGVSADSAGLLNLGFTASAGTLSAVVAMQAATSFTTSAGTGLAGVPTLRNTVGAATTGGKHLLLRQWTWNHPGGPDIFTCLASGPSSLLGLVTSIGRATFDQAGTQSFLGGIFNVPTSGPTVGTSDNSVAAFTFVDGTLPGTWASPNMQASGVPLTQTLGGTNPFWLDAGYASALSPGSQTGLEALTVLGSDRWLGAIVCFGP